MEHELAEMGATLIEPSIALARWVSAHPDIERSRRAFDAR